VSCKVRGHFFLLLHKNSKVGISNRSAERGKRGARTQHAERFESKDVIISDKTFFIESLRTWGDDPCALVTTSDIKRNDTVL
jgi:hypothetical protein